jgi:hypothetical protein
LSQPSLQEQGYNEQSQQGKSEVGALAALFERFGWNHFGADRRERLTLALANQVRRDSKARIDRVERRYAAILVAAGE